MDCLAIVTAEMRAIAGNQCGALMANRRSQYGPVLIRQWKRGVETPVSRLGGFYAHSREEPAQNRQA